MKLNKYSFGIGDRFAQQGLPQIMAFQKSLDNNIVITPVWNKSNREHKTVHSIPQSVRNEADEAVKISGWEHDYMVDADHINLTNVDDFIDSSDFFTIDVAEYINKKVEEEEIEQFIKINSKFIGQIQIPSIQEPFYIDRDFLWHIGEKFLGAIMEAAKIYQYIKIKKGQTFIAEVSMDEVEEPQTPVELFMILSGLAQYGVELQTIAPKFTGRFNKGVDYVGNIKKFEKEFEEDLLVIDHAVREFKLPDNLKLSVHSGSDKFSIYESIHNTLKKYNKGVHVKTAGTTWLEEIAGLALSGGQGLELAKVIYSKALNRYDELTGPYATVINIRKKNLPDSDEVNRWDNNKFSQTLRHDQSNPNYNPEFRQLLHVSYKIAAESGNQFLSLVNDNKEIIGPLVTENILNNHIDPIFTGRKIV
jgi:hypothetical protein